MTKRYRRKASTVEAMQFLGAENQQAIRDWAGLMNVEYVPVERRTHATTDEHLCILYHGTTKAFVWPGDWVTKSDSGNLLPCDETTFAGHYEPVEGEAS